MANWRIAKAMIKAVAKKPKGDHIKKAVETSTGDDIIEAAFNKDKDALGRVNAAREGIEESRSDVKFNTLEDDMEKFIDEAAERHGYDRWRNNSGDKSLDDGFDGQMHDMDREDAEQSVREEIIKDLKSGMDISDVFEKWGR